MITLRKFIKEQEREQKEFEEQKKLQRAMLKIKALEAMKIKHTDPKDVKAIELGNPKKKLK